MHSNQLAYKIHANVDYVPATCEEIDCEHYRNGWQVRVEGLPPELLHTARTSGRRYTELQVSDGVTYLAFEAGQPCFQAAAHRKTRGHSPLFVVGGREGLIRKHGNADSWADDLRTHQDNILGKLD